MQNLKRLRAAHALSAVLGAALLGAACGASSASTDAKTASPLSAQVDAYRRAHEAAIVGELAALTQLKSVAADPAGLTATAQHLEQALRDRGFKVSELSAGADSAPLVFGSLQVPHAKRTVAYYAHYDGQPVTPSQWSSEPFQPVMRARSATTRPRLPRFSRRSMP